MGSVRKMCLTLYIRIFLTLPAEGPVITNGGGGGSDEAEIKA